MQKNSSIKKILLIELLICVGWCAVVLVFGDYDKAGYYYWGGFSFAILAFLVAGISLLLTVTKSNKNTTEINYIPVYYTIAYLVITLLINSYFVYRLTGNNNLLLTILNVLAFIIFIALRLFTNDYSERVDGQTSHIVEKIRPITAISSQMGTLLSISTDADIKLKLHKLKEMVDYSSNISQKASEDLQDQFLLELTQIQTMIVEKKDKGEIIKKIQEATLTWNSRNNVISSIK